MASSPHTGIREGFVYPCFDSDHTRIQRLHSILTLPMIMLRTAPRQYIKRGLMPKALKKRHQRFVAAYVDYPY